MKRIVSALSAVILAVTLFGTNLAASAQSSEKAAPSGIAYSDIGSSIDSYIKEREAGLASCAVSVFDGDGTVFDGYYGYADFDNGISADENTVYEWGSTSKMLVWTSVMQQWEQGNLDLNADVREYLPEGFLTKLQYPDEKITMINLMSHNAGFQESFYENQEAAPDDVYDTLEDAVKACECYQAFHVGEYTVYSNWSTALAAYIVEQTSGIDYVTYVNENIFAPLGMEHSSIEPQQKDNKWVAQKRHELKCYGRYAQEEYNADYGECRYAVQLFPAGACMSTLGDLSKFGHAFVSEDCPLFENRSTRDEMFKATSYFGDTDVAKNCHGLWTQEYKVETLGHGGNTGGCTANLEFDPVSGLGIAVLTNEPGETAFCNGIPVLLYGYMNDREGYGSFDGTDEDISGIYYTKRSICEGEASASQYMGMIFPLCKDDAVYGFILFGIICLLTLIIKLIVFMVKKIRKTDKKYIPVMIISAKITLSDRVLGIDLGADDYITKPFEPLEVAAKVKAQLRRLAVTSPQAQPKHIIAVGDISLDLDECTFINGEDVMELTKAEFKVLELLMSQPRRVFTKEQIYESAWYDDGAVDDNTIRVIISRLRDKVGAGHIKTIRGLGYRFEK